MALWIGLGATPVFAGNSEVTITISAFTVGNPEGFIVTYVNDRQVDLSWTMPEGATKVMVRSAPGREPEDRTDGNLVYYGSDNSCSDTGISLDETLVAIYYRAWSQNAGGAWSQLYSEGQIGGERVIFLGILAFAGIMSFLAFRSAFFGLKLMAAMSWFIFLIYIRANPPLGITEGSGAHVGLIIISMGMGVMIVLAGLGRGIEQTKDRTGAFSIKTQGFNLRLPDFMKDQEVVRKQKRQQSTDEYNERFYKALHPTKRK